MKAKKFTQSTIEEVLNSLDGMSRAEMPTFFYTRLKVKLDNRLPVYRGYGITKPVISLITVSVLLILNIAVVSYQLTRIPVEITTGNGIQKFAQEYNLEVSSVYNDKTNR